MSNKGVLLFVFSRFYESFYVDKVDKGAPLRSQMRAGAAEISIYPLVYREYGKELALIVRLFKNHVNCPIKAGSLIRDPRDRFPR